MSEGENIFNSKEQIKSHVRNEFNEGNGIRHVLYAFLHAHTTYVGFIRTVVLR